MVQQFKKYNNLNRIFMDMLMKTLNTNQTSQEINYMILITINIKNE